MANKPKCKLSHLYPKHDVKHSVLVTLATDALIRAGLVEQAQEMTDKCMSCECYHEALAIIGEYVEIE